VERALLQLHFYDAADVRLVIGDEHMALPSRGSFGHQLVPVPAMRENAVRIPDTRKLPMLPPPKCCEGIRVLSLKSRQ
jgi:hypothetical protein